MRETHFTLHRTVVHRKTLETLRSALGFRDFGLTCPASWLLAMLVFAAGRLTSLLQACQLLADHCGYETLRKALHANLPGEAELTRRLNAALAAVLPRALTRRRQHIAIDLHLCPYHGEPQSDPDELVRGKSKSGTTHFHAYATAYVVRKGQRFTLAFEYVRAGDRMPGLLKTLLKRTTARGVKPSLLLLDRGFWNVDVLRYLHAARYAFLMPVTARGNKEDHPQGPTSTRRLYAWKKSGFSTYTLNSKQKGRRATVPVCVSRITEKSGRKKTLVYAYHGFTPRSTGWVRETYRTRYGIESSYRQMNQSRLRTTTRSPLVRMLRIALSLILRNVWVWVHYELLSTPHRGGRVVQLGRLYYQRFLNWLTEVVEELHGTVTATPTERPVPQPLATIPTRT